MWGATASSLEAFSSALSLDCIEWTVDDACGVCEMFLQYARDEKVNSNTLEAKLLAAGFSSITMLTFPADNNKTAASCVSRIRLQALTEGHNYFKRGVHDDSLEKQVAKPPSGAGAGAAGSTTQLSDAEFDAKSKALIESTSKGVLALNETVSEVAKDMVRKEDLMGMASQESMAGVTAQMREMNEIVKARDATIKALEESVVARDATIKALEESVVARDTTIKELEKSVEERNGTIHALTVDKQEAHEKRDEYEQKMKQQAYMLACLRDVQTRLAAAEANLAAVTNYHTEAMRQLSMLQTSSSTTIAQLRRDMEEECEKYTKEREQWNMERAHLNAAIGNNAEVLIEHYRAHCDKAGREFVHALKRPRADTDAPAADAP